MPFDQAEIASLLEMISQVALFQSLGARDRETDGYKDSPFQIYFCSSLVFAKYMELNRLYSWVFVKDVYIRHQTYALIS